MHYTRIIIIAVVAGALSGALTFFVLGEYRMPTKEELITEFYRVENAVHVSPHSIRKQLSEGKSDAFVLVDLRSSQEYEKSHIVTAINIPAYKDPNTSAYDEKDRIINSFEEVISKNPGKDIIVYCYSIPCMTGRKIGLMLAEHDIFVKHLGIGWNEWRYYWDLWNHDGETASKVEDYIVSGKEPGKATAKELPSPCGDGEFGC